MPVVKIQKILQTALTENKFFVAFTNDQSTMNGSLLKET